MALCAVFRMPIDALLTGTYDDTEREVRRRAKRLCLKVRQSAQNQRTIHKLEALDQIATR